MYAAPLARTSSRSRRARSSLVSRTPVRSSASVVDTPSDSSVDRAATRSAHSPTSERTANGAGSTDRPAPLRPGMSEGCIR